MAGMRLDKRGPKRRGLVRIPPAIAAIAVLVALAMLVAVSGCGRGDSSAAKTVRLGYFPNFTHAAPIVGLKKGFFQKELGPKVKIKGSTFTAGPELVTALLAGQIDVAYIGPGPAIAAYSKAKNVKIIAGSNNAGAVLVARRGSRIISVGGLAGKKVAVPQLGNTQDVSLRQLLREAGLKAADRGGTVEVVGIAPADLALTFQRKEVDAALVPEPWGTILATKGLADVVVDYNNVWAGGNYPTTVLIATDEFARREPQLLKSWVIAHGRTIKYLRENPKEASAILGGELKVLTGKEIPQDVLLAAYGKNIPTDRIDREVLGDFIKLSLENGFIKSPVDVNAAVK